MLDDAAAHPKRGTETELQNRLLTSLPPTAAASTGIPTAAASEKNAETTVQAATTAPSDNSGEQTVASKTKVHVAARASREKEKTLRNTAKIDNCRFGKNVDYIERFFGFVD